MTSSPSMTGSGLAALAGIGCGMAIWSLAEYLSHRFVLHGSESLPFGGLHRAHHADPLKTSAPARSAGHFCVAGTGAAVARELARSTNLGAAACVGVALGWSAGYSSYEILHWQAHHLAPATAAGLERRRRHLRHHYGGPATNHGVTFGFWDRVFGTDGPSGPTRLSNRNTPPWMLDESGSIASKWSQAFEVARV